MKRSPPGIGSASVSISPKAARLLRDIAERKAAEATSIAAKMCDAYAREIPEYRRVKTDEKFREDVQSVSKTLVDIWLSVMRTGRPVPDQELTPLIRGARARANQGIELDPLLHAYRIALRVMWHELMSEPQEGQAKLQADLAHIGELVLTYADQTSSAIAEAYERERRRLDQEHEHRRSAFLEVILAGTEPGPGGQDVVRLPELRKRHVVVVAEVTEDHWHEHQFEEIREKLQRALNTQLTTRRRGCVVAVAPLENGRDGLLERCRAGVASIPGIHAVGVGGNASDVSETCQSYHEALGALKVGHVLTGLDVDDGELQGLPVSTSRIARHTRQVPHIGGPVTQVRPVYDFQQFAAALALWDHPNQAQRFVNTTLQPLHDLERRDKKRHKDSLWPTVESYLIKQARSEEAARLLGVSRKTVTNRVTRLPAELGSMLRDGDRASQLLLALRLRRLLRWEQPGNRYIGTRHGSASS